MAIEKVEGIVIGEILYGEASKILKIFTKKYGIISVMSKGCRKTKSTLKTASTKLSYALFDIKYKETGVSTLINASIINIFKNITMDYKDFNKKIYAFALTNLTTQTLNQKQIRKEELEKIYEIYLSALIKIDENFDAKIILSIVKLKLLEYLGVKPSIDCCSNCGNDSEIVTISSESYGYICKHCYTNEKIVSKDVIKMIRMLYYVDIKRIKKLNISNDILEEIFSFLNDYYEEHTGIYFKIDDKFKSLAKLGEIK